MECPEANLLAAFARGLAAPAERDLVERHLDGCDDCGRVLAAVARDATLPAGHSSAPPTLGPGARVGRFFVEGVLGSGGMGTVYRAHDVSLDRRVAIKVLDDTGADARLEREAVVMARLAHPNVVMVFETGTVAGRLFLVMELVEGTTLGAWLHDRPRRWSEILALFLQAGRGLAAAHAAGIVHRDFKPSNVLIGADGRPRVADFGLALQAVRRAGDATATRSAVPAGTPAYMPPEQWCGEPVDARSDQYSFCVVLHEALAGKRPEPEKGVPRLPGVPARVTLALRRGLSRTTGDRFPTMDALLDELGRALRTRRRLRLVAAAIAVALAGAVAARALAPERPAACQGSERRLLGVWDDARRAAVERAFLASGAPDAATSLRSTRQVIDRHARAWIASHTAACRATWIDHEQSPQTLDLRMACLGDRRAELAALVELLAGADKAMVTMASSATSVLGDVARCDDVASLSAAPPPATSIRTRIEALRARLLVARALAFMGRVTKALPQAAQLAVEARALGDRALVAEALLLHGKLKLDAGDVSGAEGTLLDAQRLAETSGQDLTKAEALMLLGMIDGNYGRRFDQALLEAAYARAALVRGRAGAREQFFATVHETDMLVDAGRPAEALRRAALLPALAAGQPEETGIPAMSCSQLARALLGSGLLDEAAASYRCAVERATRVWGEHHPHTTLILNNLGTLSFERKRYHDARDEFARAARLKEETLGPDHPSLGISLHNVAEAERMLGRFDEALSLYRRALAIVSRGLGADAPTAAHVLTGLGEALIGAGHAAEAIEPLERALSIRTAKAASRAQLGRTRFALARALGQGGAARARGADLLAEARADLVAAGAEGAGDLDELERWASSRR